MKLVLVTISDTHGHHRRLDLPDGDILIHAGDLTAHGRLDEVEEFNAYLGALPHRHKVVIAGNHDFCFQQQPAASVERLTNAIYLQDRGIELAGLKFYGSPWQPWFGNMAFNLPRGIALQQKWALIPGDTDVLITHGPPWGYGDRTFLSGAVGCCDLRAVVEQIKPRLHVFGHIHEAAGSSFDGATRYINASICNLAFQPVNLPGVYACEAD